jgi:hypothetical protein
MVNVARLALPSTIKTLAPRLWAMYGPPLTPVSCVVESIARAADLQTRDAKRLSYVFSCAADVAAASPADLLAAGCVIVCGLRAGSWPLHAAPLDNVHTPHLLFPSYVAFPASPWISWGPCWTTQSPRSWNPLRRPDPRRIPLPTWSEAHSRGTILAIPAFIKAPSLVVLQPQAALRLRMQPSAGMAG